ncbi:MAG: LytTR family transcriptional regulator DNA-binding domain-containing protein [Cyclobacteriaceae bacterium]|nr:LytTR family transcriptional regulator DNA-binding domain-containing protein [Cyclobacteriaceae bacterium]
MSKIKLLIVEDEMIIANDMKMMLESIGYEISGIAKSVEKAVDILNERKPDLALIDINLGKGMEGIGLGRIVRDRHHIPFIFCTSYSDKKTVDEAKQVNPASYLVKPFNKEDLFVAIEIALTNFSGGTEQQPNDVILNDSLFVKEGRLFTKVSFDEIVWIEQDRNYVEIHTATRVHPVRSTLKDFAKNLPEKKFFQVHRSFMVNVNFITAINSDIIKLKDKEIPISKNHKEELLSKIKLLS